MFNQLCRNLAKVILIIIFIFNIGMFFSLVMLNIQKEQKQEWTIKEKPQLIFNNDMVLLNEYLLLPKKEKPKEEENNFSSTIEKNEELFLSISKEEWDFLYRVARCEAGAKCETYTECGKCKKCMDTKAGQKNVVYVILNRLHDKKFPNSIEKIIFAKSQFSVVNSKKFYTVKISDFCKDNVREAVMDWEPGKSAQGALYFNSISKNYWKSWTIFLFEDEVGHYFFKRK